MSRPVDELDARVERALDEDVGPGDLTTRWTVPPGHGSRGAIVAKQRLVVAGMACVRATFERAAPGVHVEVVVADGERAGEGDALVRLEGPTREILVAERTALNFLGRLSGIATLTARFVAEVEGTGARVIDTRKTTPGWRDLEKAAVRAGGGTNHRMGLYDMVLVKENHASAVGGPGPAARRALEAARRQAEETGEDRILVEVEVRSLDELDEVLPVGVDRILLDNMDPEALREAVRRARAAGEAAPELEASGGVRLDTVRRIAETGVDFVSVGALTHSAPAADVSLLLAGAREGG